MNLAKFLSILNVRLDAQERAQFRAEQQCAVGFAGLPRVVRVFL